MAYCVASFSLYRQLRNAKAGADMSTPMAWLLYMFTVAEITAGHAKGHGCLTPLSSFLLLVLPEPAYRSKSNALHCCAKAWEMQSGSCLQSGEHHPRLKQESLGGNQSAHRVHAAARQDCCKPYLVALDDLCEQVW